jgi:hypothetical protein
MRKIPESRYDFVLHDADGEWLMPRDCPEIRPGKAESRKLKVEIRGKPSGEKRRQVAAVNRKALSRRKRDAAGDIELAESRCDFVMQDADGEWLMPRDCPEIGRKG